MPTVASARIEHAQVEGASEVFTPEFVEYLTFVHDKFAPRIIGLLKTRAEMLRKALDHNTMPAHPPVTEINTGEWTVPAVPDELKESGIEISGPASITGNGRPWWPATC